MAVQKITSVYFVQLVQSVQPLEQVEQTENCYFYNDWIIMKLKDISLFQFAHLRNIIFDFTYPNGHPKAFRPLDKICIIGQSGTGKTSLLKLIAQILTRGHIQNAHFRSTFFTQYNHNIIMDNAGHNYVDLIEGHSVLDPIGLYFPADFLSTGTSLNTSNILQRDFFYDFSTTDIHEIWHRILDDIKFHKNEEKELRLKIKNLSEINDRPVREIRNELDILYNKLEELESIENNPLKKIATEYLDVILSSFNLRVDTDFSVNEDFDAIDYIRIKDSSGRIIPNGLLSSGTLQFLLSSLPFYLLKPKEAIILFDEPERSLYPNIQKLIINHYNKFATNCQFFYATHSPIIASCFDPWEVFELKFNDEGEVYIEPYYEGEKHVDNYKVHPKYLTYELILKEVFDVKNTDGDDRARYLTELLMLEEKLKQYKKNDDNTSDDFNTTMEKYQKLGKLLSWPVKLD